MLLSVEQAVVGREGNTNSPKNACVGGYRLIQTLIIGQNRLGK